MKRAVFLDRDGTLVREAEYLSSPGELEILEGVPRALRLLAEAGYTLIVVTNQSGVARGYFDMGIVESIHWELLRRLQEEGAEVEAFYVCPHHPDFTGSCTCRKPKPGLVERACKDWDIDPKASWVVGDKALDVELARAVGCRAALVRTGYGVRTERELEAKGVLPEIVADNLETAAKEILAL